jgi:hypothetical protein
MVEDSINTAPLPPHFTLIPIRKEFGVPFKSFIIVISFISPGGLRRPLHRPDNLTTFMC